VLPWIACGGLALLGCWLGCCLIPFCIDGLKDDIHSCPQPTMSQPGEPVVQQQPPPAYPMPPPQQGGYPPPPQGYPPGPGGYPGVVTVPPPVVFRELPVTMTCPHCHASISTQVTMDTGLLPWLICGGLCLFGCWLGCCLIPFCMDGVKDAIHTCPQCRKRYHRLRSSICSVRFRCSTLLPPPQSRLPPADGKMDRLSLDSTAEPPAPPPPDRRPPRTDTSSSPSSLPAPLNRLSSSSSSSPSLTAQDSTPGSSPSLDSTNCMARDKKPMNSTTTITMPTGLFTSGQSTTCVFFPSQVPSGQFGGRLRRGVAALGSQRRVTKVTRCLEQTWIGLQLFLVNYYKLRKKNQLSIDGEFPEKINNRSMGNFRKRINYRSMPDALSIASAPGLCSELVAFTSRSAKEFGRAARVRLELP
uniref:LITAF domain-containing protein n=1 Tax=Macrostomum lignano TaxID=282301 RepID=A0A1I8IXZ4_9PLAT